MSTHLSVRLASIVGAVSSVPPVSRLSTPWFNKRRIRMLRMALLVVARSFTWPVILLSHKYQGGFRVPDQLIPAPN
ncbi:hypothetical protein QBC37DRAFT_409316 [Rhypophila decipiens]|uniref:Uncharacterized protein n=1 Tax=Rhypophila decipiens TaxID=261697 RepID=A0AAN6YI86_9PEZI|nr:hypothetical protein QBC37DRAFT_409316 [Rhypophila decipiens]